ncbi:MAG: hemin uptake protein HemP [Burkholderiales bacterium]|nr:hemin uptake protein HemP [Burkholderiales bacterium]
MHEEPPQHDDQAPAPAHATPSPRTISSRDLFTGGAREVVIEHGDRLYRMRITQAGKLILTA